MYVRTRVARRTYLCVPKRGPDDVDEHTEKEPIGRAGNEESKCQFHHASNSDGGGRIYFVLELPLMTRID